MTSIGIIANPASGKDIRRLVSHATTIDNNEKINIVERIILGAQQCGVEVVYMMPDSYNMAYRVCDSLDNCGELRCKVDVIDMFQFDGVEDTIKAAEFMEERELGCIVTLGGDGTNRGVAKAVKEVPLIAISTGTNNVYPVMIEGTIAGMGAAVVASGKFDKNLYSIKDKRIEIYKDGRLVDIALIDAVISKEVFVGSKAIWDMDSIVKIFVTKCHPASIGFSSVLGSKKIISDLDDFGACVNVNSTQKYSVISPIAAGIVTPIGIDEPVIMELDDTYEYYTHHRGTIALDGEREIEFAENEKFEFKISRNGPYHVDVKKALEVAQINGFFII